jgi:hypothetical protein
VSLSEKFRSSPVVPARIYTLEPNRTAILQILRALACTFTV